MQTEGGRQYLFGAIDRTSKVAFAELQPQATKMLAAEFLRRVLAKLPYRVHMVLTDNGIQFGNMRHQPWAFRHIFDRACTEHRFTKPGHPWTNGQVERMHHQGGHCATLPLLDHGRVERAPADLLAGL